jgi:uncharacterized RDD family membrane protein YckC
MDIMSFDQPDSGSPLGSFADKLTIETPEQTALEFAVAGIGSRFLALALDTLIQMLVGFVALFGGIFVIGLISAAMPKAGIWAAAILILFFFLL